MESSDNSVHCLSAKIYVAGAEQYRLTARNACQTYISRNLAGP